MPRLTISTAQRRCDRGLAAIEFWSHHGDMTVAYTVCANIAGEVSDEALSHCPREASAYAAALSAKHGVPIVPRDLAATYLGELLCS